MSKTTGPTLSVQGQTILIKMTDGPPATPIDAEIFLVVGIADVTPAKDSKSGTTNASGNLTLTSIVLPAGKYHVQTTVSLGGRTPEVFNGQVIIPGIGGDDLISPTRTLASIRL